MSHTIEILIVDDRPENLLALESLLEDEDYTLVSSLSGNEALSRTLEHDFALIILDVQMPEMDGFETAELLRGAEKTRFIPIIFVTAISKERHFVFKGYESGAVDYIFKPIEPDILKTKVRFFADYHRQKLELQNKNRQLFETVKNLEHALSEIKRLSGLLPICASCKKSVTTRDTGTRLRFTSKNTATPPSATVSAPNA